MMKLLLGTLTLIVAVVLGVVYFWLHSSSNQKLSQQVKLQQATAPNLDLSDRDPHTGVPRSSIYLLAFGVPSEPLRVDLTSGNPAVKLVRLRLATEYGIWKTRCSPPSQVCISAMDAFSVKQLFANKLAQYVCSAEVKISVNGRATTLHGSFVANAMVGKYKAIIFEDYFPIPIGIRPAPHNPKSK